MRRAVLAILVTMIVTACSVAEMPSPSVTLEPSSGGASPAVASHSPSPRATVTAAPSATERPSPPPSPVPSMAPKPDLRAGDIAVAVTDDLRLRSKPEVSDESVKYEPTLRWGTRLAIEGQPVAGSGYWWCAVRLMGQTLKSGIGAGWVAVGANDGSPWVVGGEAAILLALREHIVGAWAGTVTTPWVRSYQVTFVFRADGTYSARLAEPADGLVQVALYYGSDRDSPLKTYSIRDVRADGMATADIVVYFDGSETTVLDQLGDIAFQGERLTFTLTHLGRYGPVAFDLTRMKAG